LGAGAGPSEGVAQGAVHVTQDRQSSTLAERQQTLRQASDKARGAICWGGPEAWRE
jgi:hypothetical protein